MVKKFKIELSLNKLILIEDLVHELDSTLSKKEIVGELEFFLTKHYYQFGTKPYTIEFLPGKGYAIRASSDIGKISTNNFDITLKPKLDDLSFGKCLALSQYSQKGVLKISTNQLTQNIISPKFNYTTIDYLSLGLLDATTSIINNGFSKTFSEVIGASKFSGSIDLISTLQEGKTLLNANFTQIESDFNIYPNRLIKTALQKVLIDSSNAEIQKLASVLLTNFENIQPLPISNIYNDFGYSYNLPRVDYEKAIVYAMSLLNGGLISLDGKEIDLPSITIDLDQLFEHYVSFSIKKMLSEERFEIQIQKESTHPIIPLITKKKIVPDIAIIDKQRVKKFIVDTKNKYSELLNDDRLSVSNPDIYQIAYYCKALSADYAILLYPSVSPNLQFPIKSSESDSAYFEKCTRFMERFNKTQRFTIFEDNVINLSVYQIDLSSTLYNTEKSIASFCQFILFLSEHGEKY